MRASVGKTELCVKRLRPVIVLPHAEPKGARTSPHTLVYDAIHQRLSETLSVPGSIDIETPELDRRFTRHTRRGFSRTHHRKTCESAIDVNEERRHVGVLQLGSLPRFAVGMGEMS